MSKLSIYETKWTDLVFENKNKEYGAYQLRQENSKNSITALFMGLLLLTAIGTISVLISKFKVAPPTAVVDPFDPTITIVDMDPIVRPPDEPIAPPTQQPSAATPVTQAKQLVDPIVSRPEDAVENIASNTDNHPVVDNVTPGTGTVINALPTTGGGGGDGAAVAPKTNEPALISELDKMPEFPGGMSKFYTYVGNNFTRPDLDAERTLRVYVSFVIEKDGSITDIIVKNDPGFGMGKEAVRVLKSLKTKWSPGIIDGKPVRTAYNLPITIKTEAE
ncbi:energy transducer TonB [Flavobacterium sp. 1355]|jgi:protein TonB|uniref:energy transducer TonB n=1 Tax=Flavobacterium sp. 1355 TaxID=2806571 RepID=UPI001AE64B85|nr:energy transducer TonB [Flavobacterium sp. 1355]MBP1224810.1 protein TonB [Flavobacterium sp. 1355]